MSFAVIQTGGKQYKVSASEILKIERLNDEEGKTVEFKNVLFLNDNKTTEIGNPNIAGAKVEATILKNKFEKIKKLRSNNLPTIPSSLEDELKSNIFLRCDQNDLKIKLNMKNQEDLKVFKKVRDLKDSF